MRKILPLILMFFVSTAYADVSHVAGQAVADLSHFAGQAKTDVSAKGGQTLAASESCVSYISKTDTVNRDLWDPVARYTGAEYRGMVFDDAATGTLCQVDFWFGNSGGTPANNDYYAELWLLDGGLALASLVSDGRSAKVDGSSWSGAWQSFTFSTPPTYDCTGTNKYAILVKAIDNDDAAATAGEFDGTNYTSLGTDDDDNTMTGCEGVATWSAAGALNSIEAPDDPFMVIYTMQ